MSRRKKKSNVTDSEDEAVAASRNVEDMSEDEDPEDPARPTRELSHSRGTLLMTLRNVPPYTEWCALAMQLAALSL